MPLYISLVQFTEKGLAAIDESPNRLAAAKEQLKDMGGEIREFFLTMGRYDAIAIVEAPDDESITRVSLATGRAGNVRTEVMRAFDEAAYERIIGKLK